MRLKQFLRGLIFYATEGLAISTAITLNQFQMKISPAHSIAVEGSGTDKRLEANHGTRPLSSCAGRYDVDRIRGIAV